MERPLEDPLGFEAPRPPVRRRVLEHPLFHLVLLVTTFATTTLAGGAAFTPGGGPLLGGRFADGFPFSVPLLTILGIHELGHYLMCRRYGVAATLPYFLPSPLLNLIGTFGALIRIKEPIRRKKVLFDVGAAGPLAGFFAALPFLLYGVARPRASTTPLSSGTILFDYPLLVKWAQGWMHVGPYSSATVHEHPTFMAAWFGLLVTCLNLIPIGQLDGGHILRAVAGRRQPLFSGIVLGLAIVAGVVGSAVWAVFAVVSVAIMGIAHPPVEDDAEPLDFPRTLVALFCVAVFLLCFSLAPIRAI